MIRTAITACALASTSLLLSGHARAPFSTVSIGVIGTPQEVEAGDVDGDGDLDLVVVATTAQGTAVSVLRNDGAMAFVPAWFGFVGGLPITTSSDVDLGDADGDGDLDFIVNAPFFQVTVRLNAGDGTFDTAKVGTFECELVAQELGHLDGDGALDAALYGIDLVGYVGSRKGNGDGTFPNLGNDVSIGIGDRTVRAVLADVTADGLKDVLLATQPGLFLIRAMPAPGFPEWASPAQQLLDARVEDVAVDDLDGDGLADAVVSYPTTSTVAVLRGLPTGGLGPPTFFASGRTPDAVAIADLGTDGVLDVAVTNRRTGNVAILDGNGAGAFGPPILHAVAAQPTDVTAADLDGDGDVDLAVTDGPLGRVVILVNQAIP